ncbi:unnamed protein product [Gongylonema pulchrum]|uniref:WASH-7_N domain-containing protein n=1 Tax=Gongylonema pulchrum TaxID=637853 RepID=A0A183DMF2_9BILA|nr:unnamed protein product [Gongylonema pulchrum]
MLGKLVAQTASEQLVLGVAVQMRKVRCLEPLVDFVLPTAHYRIGLCNIINHILALKLNSRIAWHAKRTENTKDLFEQFNTIRIYCESCESSYTAKFA